MGMAVLAGSEGSHSRLRRLGLWLGGWWSCVLCGSLRRLLRGLAGGNKEQSGMWKPLGQGQMRWFSESGKTMGACASILILSSLSSISSLSWM